MTSLAGIYRALVQDNDDPERLGRLKVMCPPVMAESSAWAAACLSPAEMGSATTFIPPAVGAEVWVVFEGGNSAYPVWIGCGWSRITNNPPQYPPPGTT